MREACEQCRGIDEARMIRHVDIVPICAHVFGAKDTNPGEDAPGDQPAPPSSTPVLHRAGSIEGPQQQRYGSHHHRVGVPQQIGEGRPEINKKCLQLVQPRAQLKRMDLLNVLALLSGFDNTFGKQNSYD